MKQHSEHLSDAQIEQYGERGSPSAAAELDRDMENHLAECSLCSERILSAHRLRFALQANPLMKASSQNAAPTSDCTGEDALRDLAAGICPPEQAAKISQHAGQCEHCGPVLRAYTEDFSKDLSDEDHAVLEKLKISSANHQRGLAKRMLVDSVKAAGPRRRFSWRWVLVPVATAACGLIAIAVWYQQRETPKRVEKLLAQAYTENRQLEMRIPYAKHAEFRQLRSGDDESALRLPESIRRAASEISSQLSNNSEDPKWLLLSARLDLLGWHYKTAIVTLDKIEDQKLVDPYEVLGTKALALYEKGEIEHDPQAYGKAVDLLGKVLQKAPDDPIALFNQGVACEKLYMYECAISDYEQFLKIDPNSGWSSEAKDHLIRIQEKKNLAP